MFPVAYADDEDGFDEDQEEQQEQEDTSHESEGDSISAGAARISYTSSGGPGESGESLTSETGWTPPACYYAPVYTPTEMEAYQQDFLSDFHTPPWPPEDVQAVRDSVEE